ncbi:aldose 1-epimerase family protein [Jiangella asiatica]|uniref:aldose 1-epimerase family protein n=1 Tax=Jiangella asiatica TaxID=2530372 RepID=UPI0013A5D492|nr:aldose 1-epimerase family protein [Jiangella asiatica]
MHASPGDTDHHLALGATRATVSEYAASLRALTVDGIDLVQRPAGDGPPALYASAVLVPWPNRVDGGRWSLHGVEQQLELTEPAAGNAVHGLLAATRYSRTAGDEHAVTLGAPVTPQPGYPFHLDTSVAYVLEPDGVVVRHTIVNRGAHPAPVAIGTHPYLRVGTAPVAELTVTVPAARAIELDERYMPTGTVDVAGTVHDLSDGVLVGPGGRHGCWTGLDVVDGRATSTLRAPDGTVVELWQEPDFGYVQLWVTDSFPGADGVTTAVAVEPMTAPPNALRSGEALRWLEPGETWTTAWGIRLRR